MTATWDGETAMGEKRRRGFVMDFFSLFVTYQHKPGKSPIPSEAWQYNYSVSAFPDLQYVKTDIGGTYLGYDYGPGLETSTQVNKVFDVTDEDDWMTLKAGRSCGAGATNNAKNTKGFSLAGSADVESNSAWTSFEIVE
jgi:hypothetical protein